MTRSSLRQPIAIFAFFALAACASLGTPADQEHVSDLWQRMQGYTSWSQLEGWEGVVVSIDGTHGDFVQVWMNDVAAADPKNLPVGSIVVKEGYRDEAGQKLNAITVMERRAAGYDPEHGDWFWGRFEKDGTPTHAGGASLCIDCHDEAGGDDYSFLNDDL
jgi:hypothetical protein